MNTHYPNKSYCSHARRLTSRLTWESGGLPIASKTNRQLRHKAAVHLNQYAIKESLTILSAEAWPFSALACFGTMTPSHLF